MRLRIKWGDDERKFELESPDFGVDTKSAVAIAVFLENALIEKKVWEDFGGVRAEIIGGTTACRWFMEQLNPLGKLGLYTEQARLDDLVYWLTDVYREGITEAAVLTNYFRSLAKRCENYKMLSNYRDAARGDSAKVLLGAVEDSALSSGLVAAKVMRYKPVMPFCPNPNEAAVNENVVGILQFNGKYVVTDRIKIE